MSTKLIDSVTGGV